MYVCKQLSFNPNAKKTSSSNLSARLKSETAPEPSVHSTFSAYTVSGPAVYHLG